MKVKELIEELKKFDGEMEVLVTYESILKKIGSDHVYRGNPKILLIDADGCFYKEGYEDNISEEDLELLMR